MARTDCTHLYSRAEDWPDAPEDLLPGMSENRPRYDKDLIAHWEWWLWTKYRKLGYGWEQRAWEFWRQLSGCDALLDLCLKRPSLCVHQLIVHLFFNAPIFEKPNRDRVRVFGIERAKSPDWKREQRKAQRDVRRLTHMQDLAASLDFPKLYFNPGMWWRPGEYLGEIFLDPTSQREFYRPEETLATFNKILAEARRIAELQASEGAELEVPRPARRQRKPTYSGAERNIYLTLLVEFLREDDTKDFPWTIAVEILQQFNPILLKDLFKPRRQDETNLVGPAMLADRVKKFRAPKNRQQRAHIAECIQFEKAWFRQPTVLAICPDPDFLTA